MKEMKETKSSIKKNNTTKKENLIETNLNKLGTKKLLLLNRILLTLVGISFFLIWLIFSTNNFYPRNEDNIAAKLLSVPVEAAIWPITFLALFVFIMPIWSSTSLKFLLTFLILSFLIFILTFVFLAFLLITISWFVWLLVNIISCSVIIFTLISVVHLHNQS
ncbi:MAG: hypothetical protein REH79_03165 [Spiroplasma sp.]|nr:hypothetical protein [Spiroplasma sp.]